MAGELGKWISWVALAALALALGFVAALGSFEATPRGGDLLLAAHGISGEGAHPLEDLAARVWRAGGSDAVARARWLLEWAKWSGVLLVVLVVGRCVGRLRTATAAAVLLAGILGGLAVWHWREARMDLSLSAPVRLIDAVPGGSGEVYANPAARSAVWLFGSAAGNRPPPVDLALTGAEPSRWRAALRERGWQTAVLAGPLHEVRPLLDHLLASPDWSLARVDGSGWVFRRGPRMPPSLPAAESINLPTSRETGLALAQLAERLDAMREVAGARACIRRAVEIAEDDGTVRLYASRFFAARKDWSRAAEHARAAVRAGAAGAHAHLAAALFELGDLDAALRAAITAADRAPANPDTRFLVARIQRARRDYLGEAEALERASSAAVAAGMPHGGYQAFLGQARASAGDARRAIAAYREALDSGHLGEPQTRAVREALATVESRQP